MNELRIFENADFGEVRIIEEDGKILFCGKDIAESLGYSNPREALLKHCKGVTKHDTLTKGGMQIISFITESDVYRLIIRSKLPSAEKFEQWIFEEVLPQIRKTGGYIPTNSEDTNETIMAKAYLIATETLRQKAELINKLQSLADIAETRICKKGCFSITDITKSLGFKRGQITRWAKAQGYLHSVITEVNKLGEEFFVVYSSDMIHNQIGLTKMGVQLVTDNKEEILKIKIR
ncbi:MAG: BRO family protein [Bacilli bacterium]